MCGSQQKDSRNEAGQVVQALHFDKLSELARKGEDFWRLVIYPGGAARNKLSGKT